MWQIYFGDDFDEIEKDKLASFLFYNKGYSVSGKEKCFVIDRTKTYDVTDSETITFSYLTDEIVSNWYPKTFAEKVDLFLLYLSNKSNFAGDVVIFTNEEMNSVLFVKRDKSIDAKFVGVEKRQKGFISDYLVLENYVRITESEYGYTLLPKGLKRVDEFQKNDENNKNVFVSMSFKGTENTREAIRQGIITAGYSPEFIDETIHNHQIVPEMFRLIRESKFLILDISDPNYGAYYEAGYALGLGKEVIICCNEDVFNGNFKANGNDITGEEAKKFERYLKPHFDIAQKQILFWKDHADLTKKLSEWIKALF